MNGHNEINNRIKSIIEQKKEKNPCNNSLIQVRTKKRKENNYTFCKQKGHKATNCNRRVSIGNKVDPNYFILFMENSCPFKIAEEIEISTIIQSDKMIWRNVSHLKIHLIKSKINPNNKRPDKNYLFAIVTCHGVTGLAIPSSICCSIELNCLTSFLHSSKLMTNGKVFSSIDEESIGEKNLCLITILCSIPSFKKFLLKYESMFLIK